MMPRQIFARAAISMPSAMLAGCALPLGISVASYTFDAFSYATEGKSISDLALTNVTGEDCAMLRLAAGEAVCRDNTPDEVPKKDRFVADARNFIRHTDRADDFGAFYAQDHSLVMTAVEPDLGQTPEKSGTALTAEKTDYIVSNNSPALFRPLEISRTLPSPVAGGGNGATEPGDPVKIASNWTGEPLAMAEPLNAGQIPRPTALPAGPRQRQAVSAKSSLPHPARSIEVANAMSAGESPETNPRGQPFLAPRLGLDLDTVLLSKPK